VSTYPDHILRVGNQHLAELKRKAAEFERQLWDAHESLEQEIEQSAAVTDVVPGGHQEAFRWTAHDAAARDVDRHAPQQVAPAPHDEAAAPEDVGPGREGVGVNAAGPGESPVERTALLVDHGRRAPKPSHRSRNTLLAGLAGAVAVALLTMLVVAVTRPGPSWPASVATVERQIETACRNPDVRSEPNLVNFACGKSTRQILWVFSLMTSGNNPNFASIRTGRQGLEPITPAQGGQVAWSLNLHHPYNPADPIDSLQVAARAINNIIGGATLTAASGKPVVQPGLVSVPANCARYTGSGAVTSRAGYPAQCAKPIASEAGQGNLVADVFRKWMVGAPPSAAENAAVLFENADNPGDPRVRAILRSLKPAKLSG
jgi:hypothetical protein